MSPQKNTKVKRLFHSLIMVGVICTLIVSGLGLLWISSFKIPALNTFEERKVSQSTKIYD